MHPVPPPPALLRSLIDGPSLVTQVEWFDEVDSTNRAAMAAARSGAPEGFLAIADVQSAGRGRHGRTWLAPAGTSLLLSLLLRPPTPIAHAPLLPLLAAVALAETVTRHLPGHDVALKWPNDLLVDGSKAAGILAEASPDAVVLGVGVDVDWREVPRPPELASATSLAEAAGRDVDRWRLLAGLVGVFSRRYAEWQEDPTSFLPAYREMSATIGRTVRVSSPSGVITGAALDVDAQGHLRVDAGGKVHTFAAGDVEHVR